MNRLTRGLVALLSVLVLTAMVAMAGPGWQCKGSASCGGCAGIGSYDSAKSDVVSGQVVSLEPVDSQRCSTGQGVILKVNSGNAATAFYLGPQWYLDRQTVKIAVGDTVEIKGSKTALNDDNVYIAAEVKKGSEILKLRDENGAPVWMGPQCGGCKGGV
ncbi:MAG: DNA-binding protein [Nitrospirae bacterium]|nr:DNA-binding protein [Nitrospirota bacterium]